MFSADFLEMAASNFIINSRFRQHLPKIIRFGQGV